MRTCVLDPVSDTRWAELVQRSPSAGIFHHPLWLALLHDCYRYPIRAVCLTEGNDQVIAGMPIATIRSVLTGKRLVSLPFCDVCGPIAETPLHERELLEAVDALRRRLGLRLEVHGEVPLLPASAPADKFYHYLVPLEGGTDAVLSRRVDPAKRRGASRARRLGATITQGVDAAAIDAFFRLQILTRHKHGLPTQPQSWFRGLGRLFDRGLGFVLLVEFEDRPIAAAIFLRHGATLTYKYGASDPAHLDKHPNDLLHIEALRIACAGGCSVVDLGRAELDNVGLQRFKRELGADERGLTYTMAPPDRRKSVRSVSTLQKGLIRHAPPMFGRVLGATIYRHFG